MRKASNWNTYENMIKSTKETIFSRTHSQKTLSKARRHDREITSCLKVPSSTLSHLFTHQSMSYPFFVSRILMFMKKYFKVKYVYFKLTPNILFLWIPWHDMLNRIQHSQANTKKAIFLFIIRLSLALHTFIHLSHDLLIVTLFIKYLWVCVRYKTTDRHKTPFLTRCCFEYLHKNKRRSSSVVLRYDHLFCM